jgi:hypothetical protein
MNEMTLLLLSVIHASGSVKQGKKNLGSMGKGLNSRVQEWQRVVRHHHHPGIILDFPPWLKFRQGKCVVGSDSPALVINEERRRRQQTSKNLYRFQSIGHIVADLITFVEHHTSFTYPNALPSCRSHVLCRASQNLTSRLSGQA